jgi:K+-transporting ATPase ATPase C chain
MRWFHSRPSATGDDARATAFSNAGPNSRELRDGIAANARHYLALERPYNPGLAPGDIPPDAVQTSASGVDPHISPANARLQAGRVAAVNRIPRARVLRLVDENTDDRSLGVLGEPGVNVLELNLAIDREARR